eukprot:5023741-Prymnesium_polylepis.1
MGGSWAARSDRGDRSGTGARAERERLRTVSSPILSPGCSEKCVVKLVSRTFYNALAKTAQN